LLAQGLGPIAVKRLKLGKGAAPMAAARAELKVLVRVMPAFVPPSVIWYREYPSVRGWEAN